MLWFVSAAWRRYATTRLALAQRAHLCGELAERGIEANCVIVADDENLDIAREFGFATVERGNLHLGAKFNDGFEYACRRGDAEYVVLIGSDNWMHIDLFDRMPCPVSEIPTMADLTSEEPFWVAKRSAEIITGRQIGLVDLETGRMRHCVSRGRYGVIPWIVHRKALEHSSYRPIKDQLRMGIDGSFVAGLGIRAEWIFRDPHELSRIDFKSSENMNSFDKITLERGVGEESASDPWGELARWYPDHLVEMAQQTCDYAVAA